MKIPFFVSRSGSYTPFTSCRFLVLFGITTLGFQSVSGIGTKRSVTFVSEGGKNDFPLLIPQPQTDPLKLTFKRGYQMRSMSVLGALTGLSLNNSSAIEEPGNLGLILVLDDEQNIKAIFSFISQGVIEWQLGELNAQRSEPLIETFTITHKGLKNIPIPSLF